MRGRLRVSWRRSGCTLPHELGIGGFAAGPVVVRKATPEELAELKKKLGPPCPPEKAKMIREKYKTLAGLRTKPKKKN